MNALLSVLKSRTLGLVVASALVASTALTPALASDDPIVARVNGEEIHRSSLEQIRAAIPYLKDVPLEHVYDALLDNVISLSLVAAEARKEGLEKDPAVKRNIVAAERQILRSVYLNRQIDKKLTEKTLKADYKVWLKENPPQKEIHARHILVKTEKEARDIIKALNDGKNFETLAKEKSTGPSATTGGDLGFFKRSDMVKPFAEAAFSLKKGKYSKDPVKTQFGWHVIKVEESRTAKSPTFKDMEPKLREKAAQGIALKIEKSLRENAKIERFKADGSAK